MTSRPVLIPIPPAKRRKSEDRGNIAICILCSEQCEEVRSFTDSKWEKFKETAKQWKGLDKYGDVYDKIHWDKGASPEQSTFHRNCISYIQTTAKLTQAKNRLAKRLANNEGTSTSSFLAKPPLYRLLKRHHHHRRFHHHRLRHHQHHRPPEARARRRRRAAADAVRLQHADLARSAAAGRFRHDPGGHHRCPGWSGGRGADLGRIDRAVGVRLVAPPGDLLC